MINAQTRPGNNSFASLCLVGRVGDGVRDQWLGTEEGNVSPLKTCSARQADGWAAASCGSLSEVRFLPAPGTLGLPGPRPALSLGHVFALGETRRGAAP